MITGNTVIELDSTSGILVEYYSDILYASFVSNGRRFTQAYPHKATKEEIKLDAERAIKRNSIN